MKKFFLIIITCSFFACTDSNIDNNCVPFIGVDETINLDLPQYTNLLVPSGWAYASGGQQGLILYNVNGSQFKAFDRLCPGQIPSSCSQMFVNSLQMVCPCNGLKYNLLNGAPITEGSTCFAKEYLVRIDYSKSVLRITNF